MSFLLLVSSLLCTQCVAVNIADTGRVRVLIGAQHYGYPSNGGVQICQHSYPITQTPSRLGPEAISRELFFCPTSFFVVVVKLILTVVAVAEPASLSRDPQGISTGFAGNGNKRRWPLGRASADTRAASSDWVRMSSAVMSGNCATLGGIVVWV